MKTIGDYNKQLKELGFIALINTDATEFEDAYFLQEYKPSNSIFDKVFGREYGEVVFRDRACDLERFEQKLDTFISSKAIKSVEIKID